LAVLPIVKYGNDVLRRPTDLVTDIDGALQKLIDDMVDTMHAAPGVGLAANQIGVSKRLAVIDLSVGKRPNEVIVLINPEIVEVSDESQTGDEGCLSFPDIFVPVIPQGETSPPTQPPTDTVGQSSGTSTPGLSLPLIVLALGGLMLLMAFVTPVPATARNRKRR
jgi:hypothetical protein